MPPFSFVVYYIELLCLLQVQHKQIYALSILTILYIIECILLIGVVYYTGQVRKYQKKIEENRKEMEEEFKDNFGDLTNK